MKNKLLQLWPFASNESFDSERQFYEDYLEQRRLRNCSSISSVAASIITNADAKKIKIKSSSTVTIVEHNLTIDEVSHKYNTSITDGLDEQEALERLKKYGPNTFTPPKSKRWYLVLAREMFSGFALLLWFAGLASIGTFILDHDPQDLYLGIALILTIVITGLFSYYQQMSSSKVFKSFQQMMPQKTFVLRNGKRREILVEQLVIGDVVFCQAGDRVPADIRVIRSDGMKIDNSSITGESEPLLRISEHEWPINQTVGSYLEAKNLAFFSTNCTDGQGVGIVIGTGDKTVIGDLANTVTHIQEERTPIAKEIASFVNIVTFIAIISGLALFGLTLHFGMKLFQAFITMIGVTIGNVPEGLLPTLTVVLTLAAKRMASKKCLVKRLETVETLGSTSVICTDKTGTLTQNKMTVEHIWFGTDSYLFRNAQLQPVSTMEESSIVNDYQEQLNWLALKRCAMLCSRAEFLDDNPVIQNRKTMGDASETAILKFLQECYGFVKEFRISHPKQAEKPFSSTTKYQYSIHWETDPNTDKFKNYFLVMKGAPERILERCKYRIDECGNTVEINDSFIQQFENMYRKYGSNGERVLAFCDRIFTIDEFPEQFSFDGKNHCLDEIVPLNELRFLGIISMIDPPRPDVPNAVMLCRQAGIRVVMITGDHPITAQAIAKKCGIISVPHRGTSIISLRSTTSMTNNNQRSIVIPGNELDEMTDNYLANMLEFSEIVFARTSPKQKLRVVEQLQKMGKIVAVTGDGVNDSLALKKANIGIAMGITGSEVSKQAADMILMDDNFSTIVLGVEEGRRIFDNLKKTIAYILAGNVTTMYPFIVYALFGYPLAINTPIALLIALGTDLFPAISLAYEKSEPDIMNHKPRDANKDRMVDGKLLQRSYLTVGVLITAGAYFSYFISMINNGYTPSMLWNSRKQWNDINDKFPRWIDCKLVDTTLDDRKLIETEAQTAYFAGIIVMQWINVITCTTRRASIFQHGFRNVVLVIGLLFETCLAALFIYAPFLNEVMRTHPVSWHCWLWTMPFMLALLSYEEFRKWIIRRYPNSFMGKEFLS